MSVLSAEVQWFDEPLDVTPEREARLYEWAAGYAGRVRDMWAENGEDVTTAEADEAYRLVAYSMLVPERPTWMPLGRAFYVQLGLHLGDAMGTLEIPENPDPGSDAALELRDALRTINTATEDEKDWVAGCHLGVDADEIAKRRHRSIAAPIDADTRTALYRHFDADGLLLYVGISINPTKRTEQHRRTSRWARLSESMTVKWFPNQAEALAAERAAIAAERPIFNTTHAGREAKERAINYLLDLLPA